MKWFFILGITLVLALMILFEWPRVNPNQKKEKTVFVILVTMDWLLATLLLFYPNLPSPLWMIKTVFQPLSQLLEK